MPMPTVTPEQRIDLELQADMLAQELLALGFDADEVAAWFFDEADRVAGEIESGDLQA